MIRKIDYNGMSQNGIGTVRRTIILLISLSMVTVGFSILFISVRDNARGSGAQVINGDLYITGDYTIENTNYIWGGNITVDGGTLTLKNSHLFFAQTNNYPLYMSIKNDGRLIMDNSNISLKVDTINPDFHYFNISFINCPTNPSVIKNDSRILFNGSIDISNSVLYANDSFFSFYPPANQLDSDLASPAMHLTNNAKVVLINTQLNYLFEKTNGTAPTYISNMTVDDSKLFSINSKLPIDFNPLNPSTGSGPNIYHHPLQVSGSSEVYLVNTTPFKQIEDFENGEPAIETTNTSVVKIYRWLDAYVYDGAQLPVGGSKITLRNHADGTPVQTAPPQEILDYLGRMPSNYNYTDNSGHCLIPVQSDKIDAEHPNGNYSGTYSIWAEYDDPTTGQTYTTSEGIPLSMSPYPDLTNKTYSTNITLTNILIPPPGYYYSTNGINIEVSGTQTKQINSSLAISGYIWVNQSGTLEFNDAIINILQTNSKYFIILENNATLTLTNVTLGSAEPLNIYMYNNSMLKAVNSTLNINAIAARDNTSILLENTIVNGYINSICPGAGRLTIINSSISDEGGKTDVLDMSTVEIKNSIVSGGNIIFDNTPDTDEFTIKDTMLLADVTIQGYNYTAGNPDTAEFINSNISSANVTYSQNIKLKGTSVMNTVNDTKLFMPLSVDIQDASKMIRWFWLKVNVLDGAGSSMNWADIYLYGYFNYTDPDNNPYEWRLLDDMPYNLNGENAAIFKVRAYIDNATTSRFVGNYKTMARYNFNGTMFQSSTSYVIMYGNNETTISFQSLKPDLAVTVDDIVFSNDLPSIGNPVNIDVTVENNGNVNATNVNVTINDVSYSFTESYIIPFIPVGGSNTASISWVPQVADYHAIEVIVDSNNNIIESNENNNTAIKWVQVVPKPDLTITMDNISNSNPVVDIDNITISADVRNIGQTDVNDVTITLYDASIPVDSTVVNISANQNTTVTFHYTFEVAGMHSMSIKVDSNNVINETDENNNEVSFDVNVVEKPDLMITPDAISFGSSHYQDGDDVLISASITNIGAINNITTDVSIYADENRIYTGNILINASETKTINATWNGTTRAGTYVITVIVDEDNLINEDNEDNNEAQKTLKIYKNADLVSNVSMVQMDPKNPFDGAPLTITVPILNIGESNVTDVFNVSLDVGSVYHDEMHISTNALPLVVGGQTSLQFTPWIAVYGDYTVTITVDPNGVIKESNETNNVWTFNIHVRSKPEFYTTPSDIWMEKGDEEYTGTGVTYEGDTLTMYARIYNIGEADGEDVIVSFLIDDVIISNSTVFLKAGNLLAPPVASAEWIAIGGSHKLTVVVDSSDLYTEMNETNNTVNVTFNIDYLPDLSVSNITVTNTAGDYSHLVYNESDKPLMENNMIIISAVINNTGMVNVTNISIALYVEAADSEELAQTITGINISAMNWTQISFDAFMISAGKALYTIEVDPDDNVFELSEDNNMAEVPVFAIAMPDLSLSDVTMDYQATSENGNLTARSTAVIGFNVTYTGELAAENITVNFTVMMQNETGWQPSYNASIVIAHINATSPIHYTFNWTPEEEGHYLLSIFVDPENELAEKIENNNMVITAPLGEITVDKRPFSGFAVVLDAQLPTKIYVGESVLISGHVYYYYEKDANGTPIPVMDEPAAGVTVNLNILNDVKLTSTTGEDGAFTFFVKPSSKLGLVMLVIKVNGEGKTGEYSGPVSVEKKTVSTAPTNWLYIVLGVVALLIIIVVVAVILTRKSAESTEGMAKCGVCGASIPVDATVCPKCGTEFGDMIECGNCHAIIPADSKKCPNCGVVFETATGEFGEELLGEEGEEEEKSDEEEESEEEEEGKIKCPNCGELIPIDSEVCPACGAPIAGEEEEFEEEVVEEEEEEDMGVSDEETVECFNCGKPIPITANKCPYCGIEFE